MDSVLNFQALIDLDDRLRAFDYGRSELHDGLLGKARKSMAKLKCVDFLEETSNSLRRFLLTDECFCHRFFWNFMIQI
jgi:hypothetical protein